LIPIAQHAETLEIARLAGNLFSGVLTAFLPERGRIQLFADFAEFLLDGEFNRQTVAVPTRHVRRIKARKKLRLDDDDPSAPC
jgi:hypothetical protein